MNLAPKTGTAPLEGEARSDQTIHGSESRNSGNIE